MNKHRQPVYAKTISKEKISYECPYCYTLRSKIIVFSPFNKYGMPYKSAKRTIHYHGNHSETLEDRDFYRMGHCTSIDNCEMRIIVDEKTKRN